MNSVQSRIEEIAREFLFEPNSTKTRSALCQRVQEQLTGQMVTTWDDDDLETPVQIQEAICHDDTTEEHVGEALVMLQVDLHFADGSQPVAIPVSIGPELEDLDDWVTVIRPDIGPPRD